MLTWFLLIIGFAIIAIAMIDVIWSTISTNGGGPIAMRLSAICWKVARIIFKRFHYHRILEFNTVVILILTFLVWVLPMWFGWTVIFSASEAIVIHQSSGEAANLADRVYFSGMVFLTLGSGDFVASKSGWRILTTVAALNGLVVITLTITYLISIISAAIDKRKLAVAIKALGQTGVESIVNGWDGHGFSALEDQLQDLSTMLMTHAERHLAYPILQYFHPTDHEAALPPALAVLDDIGTILSECVKPEARPPRATIQSVRRAIDIYIRRVQLQHITDVEEPPPTPDFDGLRASGIPVRDDEECHQAFEHRSDVRCTLFGLVEAEGWQWPH